MKKNNSKQNIGAGSVCKKCNGLTVIRKRIKPPKINNFYYTQWEFCEKCRAVYFEERYKSNDWQEVERQESFFNSLKEI